MRDNEFINISWQSRCRILTKYIILYTTRSARRFVRAGALPQVPVQPHPAAVHQRVGVARRQHRAARPLRVHAARAARPRAVDHLRLRHVARRPRHARQAHQRQFTTHLKYYLSLSNQYTKVSFLIYTDK